MLKRCTLIMSSKDVENPEYMQVLTMVSETSKASRVIIYSNNNKYRFIEKCYETHNIALISMMKTFFEVAIKDEFDIENAEKDYFYQSLAEAIFYYVDSEFFCNHFAYNEIIIKSVEMCNSL